MSSNLNFKNKYIGITIGYFYIIMALFLLDKGYADLRPISFFIAIILALTLKKELIIVELAALIPVMQIFKLNGLFTAFPLIAFVFVIKSFFSKTKISLVFLLYFAVSVVFSVLSAFIEFGGFVDVLSFYIYILLVYYAVGTTSKDSGLARYLDLICLLFCFSLIVEGLGSIVFPKAARTLSSYATKSDYTTMSYGLSTVWAFGMDSVIGLALCTILFFKKKINIILYVGFVISFLYFIVITARFTSIIGLAFLALLMPLMVGNPRKKGYLIKYFATMLTLILVSILVYNFILKDMISQRGGISDNGRFDIWKDYLLRFTSNIRIAFFGIGADSIMSYASKYDILSTHNIIIEKLFEFGIVGLLLITTIFRIIYRNSSFSIFENKFIVPLMLLIVMTFFQGVTGNQTFFILLVLVGTIKKGKGVVHERKTSAIQI